VLPFPYEVVFEIMNAFQPSRYPAKTNVKRRIVSGSRRHMIQRSHQIMALENTAKIGVNLTIIAASISALVQLLPYHWLQQNKLREAHTELTLVTGRVKTLETQFSRNFDPQQAKSIMQQQSYRIGSNQRRIVLISPDQSVSEKTDVSP
jgi:hypothetical protein